MKLNPDKIINGGMKVKLILSGVCVILLIAMILVLCLTGGEETPSTTDETTAFVSESSEGQAEAVDTETPDSSAAGSTAEPVEDGTVNQQESGETAEIPETPATVQTQPDATDGTDGNGQQPPTDISALNPVPTTEPAPSPTASPQAPQQGNGTAKPDMTIVVEQKDDEMVVTTGYCVVEYPFAFSEIIEVALKETDTGAALEFIASIRGQTAPLYTLWLNTNQGIPYGTITTNGYTASVNVETYTPTGLTDENKVTFNAAQETINEVLQSLENRNTFVAAI